MVMPAWLVSLLTSAVTLLLTLTITLIFNRVVSIPKELKKQREIDRAKEEQLKQENRIRDSKIAALETAVTALTAASTQLQSTDTSILSICTEIKNNIITNQELLNERLDRLEDREKNAIRAKLLDEYRLFTDETKNPMRAWSEMEHHAFFKLVKDYEGLNGNDYVHSDVIPDMNKLEVIPMIDKERLLALMQSRRL